jgi:hypothetical protein
MCTKGLSFFELHPVYTIWSCGKLQCKIPTRLKTEKLVQNQALQVRTDAKYAVLSSSIERFSGRVARKWDKQISGNDPIDGASAGLGRRKGR